MTIERSKRPVAAARIAAIARRLLDASMLCAIATVSRGGRAHVNTAYFAWGEDFDIVWVSAPRATHSRNVRANGSVAVAVYDSSQAWGKPDRGIQLFGSARELTGGEADSARRLYAARFRANGPGEPSPNRLYRFQPRALKVFDERELGGGVFVTARVDRDGQVAWQRTERYRA